jgi:hypothetical protein
MIVFTLRCADGHEFEAWFRDSRTFDRQAKAGAVACPSCGNTEVVKAPMAPRLARSEQERRAEAAKQAKQVQEMRKTLETLRTKVEESCDYVGPSFAEEARKIHYGETEKRGIYGESTDKEAKELRDEGIPFQRVPWAQRHDS